MHSMSRKYFSIKSYPLLQNTGYRESVTSVASVEVYECTANNILHAISGLYVRLIEK